MRAGNDVVGAAVAVGAAKRGDLMVRYEESLPLGKYFLNEFVFG